MSAKPRVPGIEIRPPGYRVHIERRGIRCCETFSDLGEAIAWRRRALEAIDRGDPLPPRRGDQKPRRSTRQSAPAPASVADAAKRLLDGIERGEIRTKTGMTYKPATFRKYESALRLHVMPSLGVVKVAALKRGDVQRTVDQIAAQRGVEQAVNALTSLRVVIRACVRYGELEADPCAGVRVPRSERTARATPIPAPEQYAALLDAADRDDQGSDLRSPCSFIGPMVRLGLDTGLRQGELLGLRWGTDGIDLDAGMVNVTQAIDRKLDRATYSYLVIAPKSRSSRRRVPIAPDTVRVMRAHRMATGRPADGALVWAQIDGRPVPPQGKAQSAWRRVREAAGVDDLRFHELRHVFGTHCLASGTGLHATAALMGHSDPGLLLRRYGHAMPDEVASAPARLEAFRAKQLGR
jgi:integrase